VTTLAAAASAGFSDGAGSAAAFNGVAGVPADGQGGAVITVEPNSPPVYGFLPRARFYGVNILSELDAVGEYYIDTDKEVIYWMPPPGGVSAADEVVLSVAHTLVNNSAPVAHVVFSGLHALYARGTGFSLPGRAPPARVGASPGPQDYDTRPASPGRSALSEQPNAPATRLGTGSPRLGSLAAATGTGPAVGPLNYDVPSAFQPANDRALFKRSGLGASIVPRRFHGSIEEGPLMQDTPAPDAYGRAARALSETPQPRFGRSPRAPLSPRSSTPAPNAYAPDACALLREAPRYSLRSRSSPSAALRKRWYASS
jgi:hypothetical protein